MRKMSKAAKADDYDRIKYERDVYAHLAFMLINNSGPNGFSVEATETVREENDPGCVHELRLYGCTRADGGTLVYIMHSDVNRYAHVEAHRFDEWLRKMNKIGWGVGGTISEIKNAAARLSQARSDILNRDQNHVSKDW